MSEWNSVKWTEARQIAEAMETDPASWPEPDVAPKAHFDLLRREGRTQEAIDYLGQALPRFEAVAWVATQLDRLARGRAVAPLERQALDRALRWVDEPSDDFRRAASLAAERARSDSPERLLGQAVFMSGGSIAPPDLPAVLPPQNVCGRLASAALLIACLREADPAAAMGQALDHGDRIANDGLKALSPA